MSRPSDRVERLPRYAVGELAVIKQQLLERGQDVIDLAAGDADLPPPPEAVQALHDALGDSRMSRYGFQVGLKAFREAIADYMERRFAVTVDPMTEVLPLIGSKDGLVHLPLAVLNPGDVCVLPEPGYPAYIGGAVLAGAEVAFQPLLPEQDFLLELEDLDAQRLRRARLLFLNYPNNPTTAVAPREYLERTVEACHRHDVVLAYDNPYCEVTFDGYRAPSVLQVPGAREMALEFHSLSKSFCMTGWRLGWAVGSADLIGTLNRMKSYVDTGPFLAIQHAGAVVLNQAERLAKPVRARFQERRDRAVAALRGIGIEVEPPAATMYLWFPVPGGVESAAFAREALESENVMVLPGSAFGGEGFIRIALTVEPERMVVAAERLGRVVNRDEVTSATV